MKSAERRARRKPVEAIIQSASRQIFRGRIHLPTAVTHVDIAQNSRKASP